MQSSYHGFCGGTHCQKQKQAISKGEWPVVTLIFDLKTTAAGM